MASHGSGSSSWAGYVNGPNPGMLAVQNLQTALTRQQIMVGYPFLVANYGSYLSRAFEFSRQFLFKWTVNWRFVGEEKFLSREFSIALVLGHISVLALFLLTRWLRLPIADAINQLISPLPRSEQSRIARQMNPDFVLTTMLTAMLIGCQFARSLHYQFYAYIAWSTPFLLWRSGLHPVLTYAIWAGQEWAWNVYPSTYVSSMVVVGCLTLTVLSLWSGNVPRERAPEASKDGIREAK
jgi:alpha-1,3-mannosyltransferase